MPRHRTTIRRKLLGALMATSGVVLLLACAAFVAYQVVSFRGLMVRSLQTRAELLASNTTAALVFDNPSDAKELLSSFQGDAHMLAACVYDRRGHLFATYPQDAPDASFPRLPATSGVRFEGSDVEFFQPVLDKGRVLGTVYLKSDLREMSEQLRLFALVAGLVLLGSIGVAFALALVLQKRLAQPILSLTDTARTVAERKDYSLRATSNSNDELGLLTDRFNEMLDEIQKRDSLLRESEAGLRAILESALDAIITMDHKGRIIEFNPAAEMVFGYRRSQAVGADAVQITLPHGLRQRHRNKLATRSMAEMTGIIGRRDEMVAMRSDGSEFPVELAATRIPQEGPSKFAWFIRDITERKRAELEIRQLNENLERRVAERTSQLEAANKEMEGFSYSVSHDLRAPLRAIGGFSQILMDEQAATLDAEGRRILKIICDNTTKMGHLIDDLLTFSRMGRTALKLTHLDMTQLVRTVAAELATASNRPDIDVTVGDLPEVDGDLATLRQVWINLISNAIKYSGTRDRATIVISGKSEGAENIYIVKDNGVGFDMRYAGKLFGVFQRLHSDSEFEGTGVGLALVQRIVHRHGGRVWADGKLNEGATFQFALPRNLSDRQGGTSPKEEMSHA